MSRVREFDFEHARRVTPKETEEWRKAIERKLGVVRPPRGRPPKGVFKYRPIQIRIHPIALHWAKEKAKKQGVGYQTVINQTLLHAAGNPL